MALRLNLIKQFGRKLVRSNSTMGDSEWHLHNYRFFLPIQTRVADNDHYNHINNSVYHFYADTIVNCYLVWYCGLQTDNSVHRKIGYMVDTHCIYRKPLQYPQSILAGLHITKMGKSSIHYRVAFFEPNLDYMNMMKTTTEKDPHLRFGLGSQGLLISEDNKHILKELGDSYSSEGSVLGTSVHVFVDSQTQKPVNQLSPEMSVALNKIYDPTQMNSKM